MPTFGLITEGVTDQQVIQAILEGFFDPQEIDTRPFLPIADNTYKHQVQNFSNWGLVLEYCASPKFAEAFPYVDYVVVQIDTDQCDDPLFGVRKHNEGNLAPPDEIVARVAARLREKIDEHVWNEYRDRILFAIAVDTVECWLLPIHATGKDKPKTLNCLGVLNRFLTKRNLRPINAQSKDPRYYADLARPYARRRELIARCTENPSLAIFVERLRTVFRAPTTDTMPEAAIAETATEGVMAPEHEVAAGQSAPDVANSTG